MVLDDQHGVTKIDQAVQHVKQLAHVVEMQSRRWLIQDVQRAAGLAFGKFARQFDALGFAAGKRRRGLPQRYVAESHVHQRRKLLLNLGNVFQEFKRLGARQVQYVADRMSLVAHGERLGIDRKSTRLNSSHTVISYAVFCLKKKNVPHTSRSRRTTRY